MSSRTLKTGGSLHLRSGLAVALFLGAGCGLGIDGSSPKGKVDRGSFNGRPSYLPTDLLNRDAMAGQLFGQLALTAVDGIVESESRLEVTVTPRQGADYQEAGVSEGNLGLLEMFDVRASIDGVEVPATFVAVEQTGLGRFFETQVGDQGAAEAQHAVLMISLETSPLLIAGLLGQEEAVQYAALQTGASSDVLPDEGPVPSRALQRVRIETRTASSSASEGSLSVQEIEPGAGNAEQPGASFEDCFWAALYGAAAPVVALGVSGLLSRAAANPYTATGAVVATVGLNVVAPALARELQRAFVQWSIRGLAFLGTGAGRRCTTNYLAPVGDAVTGTIRWIRTNAR